MDGRSQFRFPTDRKPCFMTREPANTFSCFQKFVANIVFLLFAQTQYKATYLISPFQLVENFVISVMAEEDSRSALRFYQEADIEPHLIGLPK